MPQVVSVCLVSAFCTAPAAYAGIVEIELSGDFVDEVEDTAGRLSNATTWSVTMTLDRSAPGEVAFGLGSFDALGVVFQVGDETFLDSESSYTPGRLDLKYVPVNDPIRPNDRIRLFGSTAADGFMFLGWSPRVFLPPDVFSSAELRDLPAPLTLIGDTDFFDFVEDRAIFLGVDGRRIRFSSRTTRVMITPSPSVAATLLLAMGLIPSRRSR
ncbi:MAG: hypothetical protein AAF995_02110 [Planctomycetota bacterium]